MKRKRNRGFRPAESAIFPMSLDSRTALCICLDFYQWSGFSPDLVKWASITKTLEKHETTNSTISIELAQSSALHASKAIDSAVAYLNGLGPMIDKTNPTGARLSDELKTYEAFIRNLQNQFREYVAYTQELSR